MFAFFLVFIITCHMRSLDYKSTWTNCLYISMHSCLVFTSYLQTWTKKRRRIYNTFPLMCFIYISRVENKKQPHTICRVHRTCTWNQNVSFVWRESVVLFLITESGIAQFCNRLRLWPVLLHCITLICFFIIWLCLYCASVSEHRGLEKVNLRC